MDAVRCAENSADLVQAWREIGRIIGAYEHAKKIEIDVRQKIEHITTIKQLENMSDKQLAELAEVEGFILEGEFVEVQDDASG